MLPTSTESIFGNDLRVARLGTGPPIVLLHGYPDTLQLWSGVACRLASSFRVIAFDWPGLGCSAAWQGGATPFHMADRLCTLLDCWKIQDVHIAAIDMGGQAAAAFAIRHSKRVRSLVIMNSLLQWNEATSWEIALLRRFGWNRFALQHFPKIVFNRALRTFLPAGASLDSDLRSNMWGSFRRPAVRDFIVRMCAGYQGTLPQLAKDYPNIQNRVLLLWAEHDKHFPIAHAKRFQEAVPSAKIEVVANAHHWMPLSMPDVVAARIKKFCLA